MALSAAFSIIMIMIGVARTGGNIASLKRLARWSVVTTRTNEPLAPTGIDRIGFASCWIENADSCTSGSAHSLARRIVERLRDGLRAPAFSEDLDLEAVRRAAREYGPAPSIDSPWRFRAAPPSHQRTCARRPGGRAASERIPRKLASCRFACRHRRRGNVDHPRPMTRGGEKALEVGMIENQCLRIDQRMRLHGVRVPEAAIDHEFDRARLVVEERQQADRSGP